MEMIKVEGGIAVFLPECPGDGDVFELVSEEVPFVIKSDHDSNAFFTFLLEQYGGGGLRGGVRCRCMFRTGYLRLLQ